MSEYRMGEYWMGDIAREARQRSFDYPRDRMEMPGDFAGQVLACRRCSLGLPAAIRCRAMHGHQLSRPEPFDPEEVGRVISYAHQSWTASRDHGGRKRHRQSA